MVFGSQSRYMNESAVTEQYMNGYSFHTPKIWMGMGFMRGEYMNGGVFFQNPVTSLPNFILSNPPPSCCDLRWPTIIAVLYGMLRYCQRKNIKKRHNKHIILIRLVLDSQYIIFSSLLTPSQLDQLWNFRKCFYVYLL